jgi:hypothetical protein
MKKILFTCLLLIAFTSTGFSQSEKLKEKATELVEKLNSQITAGDESLALTDEQRDQVSTIHIERIKESRKAKKNGASDEDVKAINKKHFKRIYEEVITKEQKQARKKGKEKE